MNVYAKINAIEQDPAEGPGYCWAVCMRCNQQQQSAGTSVRSMRRCLVLLRETCPNAEQNFYSDPAMSNIPEPEPITSYAPEVTPGDDEEIPF